MQSRCVAQYIAYLKDADGRHLAQYRVQILDRTGDAMPPFQAKILGLDGGPMPLPRASVQAEDPEKAAEAVAAELRDWHADLEVELVPEPLEDEPAGGG